MKQHTAELLLVIAVMIWGSSYVGLKDALVSFSPFTIITLRFGIAFLIAALVFHRSLTGITFHTVTGGAVLGFLLFCLIALILYALSKTPTTTAGSLIATIVILVPLIRGIILKKIPELPLVIGIGLAVIGIALLTTAGEMLAINSGAVLCLTGAVFLALQIIATDEFLKTEKPLNLGILEFGFAALFGLIPALIFDPVPDLSSGIAITAILYLAIVCTMIASILQTVAQKYTTPEHTSLIFTLESVFAAIFGFILLDEVLSVQEYAGVILILSGVLIAVLTGDRNQQDDISRGEPPDNAVTDD